MTRSNDRGPFTVYCRTDAWARTTNKFFTSFFHGKGGTYLDVGANIGFTTIPVARNSAVTCIAFEPDPDSFRSLQDNIRLNAQHGNVLLHEVALYSRDQMLAFSRAVGGDTGNHRIAHESSSSKTITVRGARLDGLVGPLSNPIAAKIDVQGAEPIVLTGGTSVLSGAEALAVEFSPYHLAEAGGDPNVVLDYLSTFTHLATVQGDRDSELHFNPSGFILPRLQQLLSDWRHEERSYLDVYALR